MTEVEDITDFDSEYNYQEGSKMDVDKVTNLNNNGWAFSANTKFEKKGTGKKIKAKIITLLKQFFLNRNINPKDKLTAQEMCMELEEFVQSGEINNDDIPQVSTIHNWIGRYSREFNCEGTIIALETFNASSSSSNC
ncbi:12482_t:CDS:2 [Gigaspora margarita]|uniref:12482_t:CDS:1 n=1 Tax=Gigaspora margarita TaxID=4874 RepID=A0ABM8VVR1_GIGMA|nr:12482_t:CDS:2 [Gigaspora margarita]